MPESYFLTWLEERIQLGETPTARGLRSYARSLEGSRTYKIGRCVYVLWATKTNYYKIGITTELNNRLQSIRGEVPFWYLEPLFVHYCHNHQDIENELHQRYAAHRIRKSEWFEFDLDNVVIIREIKDHIEWLTTQL